MPVPYPQPTNITGLLDVLNYSNTVTDNYAGLLTLIVIIIVLFALTKIKGYTASECCLVSLGLGFVLGAMLWALGLVAGEVLIVVLALVMASGIWAIFEK